MHPVPKETLGYLSVALLCREQILGCCLVALEHLHTIRKEALSQLPVALLRSNKTFRNSLIRLLEGLDQRPHGLMYHLFCHSCTPLKLRVESITRRAPLKKGRRFYSPDGHLHVEAGLLLRELFPAKTTVQQTPVILERTKGAGYTQEISPYILLFLTGRT